MIGRGRCLWVGGIWWVCAQCNGGLTVDWSSKAEKKKKKKKKKKPWGGGAVHCEA